MSAMLLFIGILHTKPRASAQISTNGHQSEGTVSFNMRTKQAEGTVSPDSPLTLQGHSERSAAGAESKNLAAAQR